MAVKFDEGTVFSGGAVGCVSSEGKGGGKFNRTSTVTVRMSPRNVQAANLVAEVTGRTLSSLTEYALRRYIEKNFPEAFEEGAEATIKVDDAPEEGDRFFDKLPTLTANILRQAGFRSQRQVHSQIVADGGVSLLRLPGFGGKSMQYVADALGGTFVRRRGCLRIELPAKSAGVH